MSQYTVGKIEQLTHTPGPWRVKRNPVTVAILDADGNYITENVREVPNQGANVRLIAAAPDLLAALKAIMDPAYGNPGQPAENRRIEEQAHAAIAKAEGR